MNFWERFYKLCELMNKKPNRVASELGFSSGAVTSWKKGKIPHAEKLAKLSEYFGVSVDYLLAKSDIISLEDAVAICDIEKSAHKPQGSADANTVTVIDYSVIGKVRAGYGGMAREEYTDETCPIPTEYIKGRNKEEFFVLRISGNSMYPKLLDGDKVLVQRCTSVDSGSVAIVLYNSEEATVKTVRYAPNQDWVELIPTNPEYQTKRIEGPDLMKVQILGKVTKLIRDI